MTQESVELYVILWRITHSLLIPLWQVVNQWTVLHTCLQHYKLVDITWWVLLVNIGYLPLTAGWLHCSQLCIMDTLRPIISVLIIKVSWLSSLVYDRAAPFGIITKCVDYAGVLIFKCHIYRFHHLTEVPFHSSVVQIQSMLLLLSLWTLTA